LPFGSHREFFIVSLGTLKKEQRGPSEADDEIETFFLIKDVECNDSRGRNIEGCADCEGLFSIN
jgi:hypothetical protein